MKCEYCKTTNQVSQDDWGRYFCAECSDKYIADEKQKNEQKAELLQNSLTISAKVVANSPPNVVYKYLENIILFPFRLTWNIVVTALIIAGFIFWFGFIFGSVLGVIIILIFAPDLFLLPLALVFMYTKLWSD
jgi:hypothetical protein